jgi:hypothetical protein
MNPLKRTLLVAATSFAVTACSTAGSASPPSLDHQEGAASPVFQPMLVVPLPSLLGDGQAAGRPMDALQARATPLGDVLLALFKDSDINLVVDPAVQAMPCTFDIKRSTVEESFEALLESLDLGLRVGRQLPARAEHGARTRSPVDLMDASAGGCPRWRPGWRDPGRRRQRQGGGGAQGGGGGGFWDEIEESLPSVLGEVGTFVVNRTGVGDPRRGAAERGAPPARDRRHDDGARQQAGVAWRPACSRCVSRTSTASASTGRCCPACSTATRPASAGGGAVIGADRGLGRHRADVRHARRRRLLARRRRAAGPRARCAC